MPLEKKENLQLFISGLPRAGCVVKEDSRPHVGLNYYYFWRVEALKSGKESSHIKRA